VLGRRVEPVWTLFATEIGTMAALLLLLRRRAGAASALGIGWSLTMLAETVADIVAYRGNASFVVEEGTFALIYLYLAGLFIVYAWRRSARWTDKMRESEQRPYPRLMLRTSQERQADVETKNGNRPDAPGRDLPGSRRWWVGRGSAELTGVHNPGRNSSRGAGKCPRRD
jgi:hypothetical protein